METSEKYALWLMPEGEAYERLAALIRELSLNHHTPLFEPHITLIGGLMPQVDDVVAKSEELAASLEPFTVELGGIGYLDEYYRCLFIKVRETEEIMRTDEKAREMFGRKDDLPFMPHVSLMYGNLKASKKRKMISSIGEDISSISFEAGSLHVCSTEGEPSAWHRVEKFSFG